MLDLPKIFITEKGERHAKTGHPWVFEGEVVRAGGAQEDRPRPSCESPRPEERRRGLLLSSGLHSTSAACVPWRFGTFAQFRLVQRRMEQVPSRLSYVDLQGPSPI